MKETILTEEHIQFIDKYLQKADIIFVDVRAEMIDHVASAVEEKMQSENIEFYDAFKDFMVFNKKELLKRNNKQFQYFQEAVVAFSKTLFKPYNLVFGVFLIAILSFFGDLKYLKTINYVLFFGILRVTIIQTIYSFLILKKRYLCLENTSSVLLAIYYFTVFFNGFYSSFFGNSVSVGIALFLFFAFIVHSIVTVRKFRLSYGK
jgi:hypothetical protein